MEYATLDSQSLKVLGAKTRQLIIKELEERPHTASELSRHLDKHITTIKEHLDMLVETGLVERNEREGRKWVYYSLTRKGVRLLKPASYNWMIVLSLSIVCIVSGIFYTFQPLDYERKALASTQAAETVIDTAAVSEINILALVLIIAGVAGLIYILYKHFR